MGRLDILSGIGRGLVEGSRIAMEIDRNGGLFPNADKRADAPVEEQETENRANGFVLRTDHASRLVSAQPDDGVQGMPSQAGGGAAGSGYGRRVDPSAGQSAGWLEGRSAVLGRQGLRLTPGGIPRFANGGNVGVEEGSGFFRRVLGDGAVTALKGAIGLSDNLVGAADLVTGGNAGRLMKVIGYRPDEAKKVLDNLYSPEMQSARQAYDRAQGFSETLHAYAENPGLVIHDGAETVVSELGPAAISKARHIGRLAGLVPERARKIVDRAGEAWQHTSQGVKDTVAAAVGGASGQARSIAKESRDGVLAGDQVKYAVMTGLGSVLLDKAGKKMPFNQRTYGGILKHRADYLKASGQKLLGNTALGLSDMLMKDALKEKALEGVERKKKDADELRNAAFSKRAADQIPGVLKKNVISEWHAANRLPAGR